MEICLLHLHFVHLYVYGFKMCPCWKRFSGGVVSKKRSEKTSGTSAMAKAHTLHGNSGASFDTGGALMPSAASQVLVVFNFIISPAGHHVSPYDYLNRHVILKLNVVQFGCTLWLFKIAPDTCPCIDDLWEFTYSRWWFSVGKHCQTNEFGVDQRVSSQTVIGASEEVNIDITNPWYPMIVRLPSGRQHRIACRKPENTRPFVDHSLNGRVYHIFLYFFTLGSLPASIIVDPQICFCCKPHLHGK